MKTFMIYSINQGPMASRVSAVSGAISPSREDAGSLSNLELRR